MNDLDLNDQKGAFLEKMLLSICDHRGADWRRMMFVVRYRNRRVRVGRPHVSVSNRFDGPMITIDDAE